MIKRILALLTGLGLTLGLSVVYANPAAAVTTVLAALLPEPPPHLTLLESL